MQTGASAEDGSPKDSWVNLIYLCMSMRDEILLLLFEIYIKAIYF